MLPVLMNAASALQPDCLAAFVGGFGRNIASYVGSVPHALEELGGWPDIYAAGTVKRPNCSIIDVPK